MNYDAANIRFYPVSYALRGKLLDSLRRTFPRRAWEGEVEYYFGITKRRIKSITDYELREEGNLKPYSLISTLVEIEPSRHQNLITLFCI